MADITAAQHQALQIGYPYTPEKTVLPAPIYRQAPDWSGLGKAAIEGAELFSKSPANPAVRAQMQYQAALYKKAMAGLTKPETPESQYRVQYTPEGPTYIAPAHAGPGYYMNYGPGINNPNFTGGDGSDSGGGNYYPNPPAGSGLSAGATNTLDPNQNPIINPNWGYLNTGNPQMIPYTTNNGVVIPQLADGGIVTKPTVALVGERGPEAIVPLRPNTPPPAAPGTQMTPSPQMMPPMTQQPGVPPPAPGAGPGAAGGAAVGAASAAPPQQTPGAATPWQQQNARPPASAGEALKFIKSNYTTRAKDATYMANVGNGVPGYAIHLNDGSTNVIPLPTLVQHGFAPVVASQNTAAVMDAAAATQQGPMTPSPQQMGPMTPQPGMTPSPQQMPGTPQQPGMTPSPQQMQPGVMPRVTAGPIPSVTAGLMPGVAAGATPGAAAPGPDQFQAAINTATNVPGAGGPPVSSLLASNEPAGQLPVPEITTNNPSNAPMSTNSLKENPIPNGEIQGQRDPEWTKMADAARVHGYNNLPPGTEPESHYIGTTSAGYKLFVDSSGQDSGIPYILYKATPFGSFRMYNDGTWQTKEHQNSDQAMRESIKSAGLPIDPNASTTQLKNTLLQNYWIHNSVQPSTESEARLASIFNQSLLAQRMLNDLKYLHAPEDISTLRQWQNYVAMHAHDMDGTPAGKFWQEATKIFTGNNQVNPALKDFMDNYSSLMAGASDAGLVDSERRQVAAVTLDSQTPNTLAKFLNLRHSQFNRYVHASVAARERTNPDYLNASMSLSANGSIPDPGAQITYNPDDMVRTTAYDARQRLANQQTNAAKAAATQAPVGSQNNPVPINWANPTEAARVFKGMQYHQHYRAPNGQVLEKLPAATPTQ